MEIGIVVAAFGRSFSGPLEFFVEGNVVGCEFDTGRLAAEHLLVLFELLFPRVGSDFVVVCECMESECLKQLKPSESKEHSPTLQRTGVKNRPSRDMR